MHEIVAQGLLATRFLKTFSKDIIRLQVDQHMVRCPHIPTADAMVECIKAARSDEDSIGGVCSVVMRNVPIGLGEPCFDKLEVCSMDRAKQEQNKNHYLHCESCHVAMG